MFLKCFTFASEEQEIEYLHSQHWNCYNSFYPFGVIPKTGLKDVEFEPITIFYGGNGCGKTTALNIICEKLNIKRDAIFNKSDFFDSYLSFCYCSAYEIPFDSKMLSSDGVFDNMFDTRAINNGLDNRRHKIFEEYKDLRKENAFRYNDMRDYEQLKHTNNARRMTISQFTRSNMNANLRQFSNGETAFLYFSEKIYDNTLYLLDEPENSLSPKLQLELTKIISDASRFYGCQFVISTHSPLLLSLKGARIYDLEDSAKVKHWTELESIKAYREFFVKHENEF